MSAITVTIDLRNQFGPARDQSARPTCIAFAMSDTHAAVKGRWAELSCEYLYFHAVQRSGRDPRKGVSVVDVCDAIEKYGQPLETKWRYLQLLPADLKLWKPPATAKPVHKRKHDQLHATFDEATKLTDAGRPSVLVMSISDAFFSPTSDHAVDSSEPVDTTRKHAVVIAGTGNRKGTKFLLARSSWGEDWGDQGYAWLSERYVTPRILNLIELKEAA